MKPFAETLVQIQPKTRFTPDRVLVSILAGVILLAAVDAPQALESLRFTLTSVLHMAPFFIFAVLFAAGAKASGADRLIARAFTGSTAATVLAASLAGALSPFCSCGVIPLIAAMLASGVPLAPVMAFCVSSPIMDPEMFLLTAAGINLPFAIAKTITAFAMGIAAGSAVAGLQRFGFLADPLKAMTGCGCGTPAFSTDRTVSVQWRFWQDQDRRRSFRDEMTRNGLFLSKWLLLAFFLESLMVAYIPDQWIAGLVGDGNAAAIPLAALVGVPAYMNGYAAIPLISGLLDMGMAPGAALAFVVAGAVSSIPAALAVFALVRRPVFLLYLGIGLFGSMAAGYLYQFSGWF